jgi:hypothetical protein
MKIIKAIKKPKTPWPESASKLYRPSDRPLSVKLVPTFADRGCHVVSTADPYGRIPGFLDRYRGNIWFKEDRLCCLVVRVLGYRSGGPGSISGTTKKK